MFAVHPTELNGSYCLGLEDLEVLWRSALGEACFGVAALQRQGLGGQAEAKAFPEASRREHVKFTFNLANDGNAAFIVRTA